MSEEDKKICGRCLDKELDQTEPECPKCGATLIVEESTVRKSKARRR